MKQAALNLIRLYQRWISPLLGPACRYTPTCSHYAAEAINLHGARGVLLAVWRLLRCHPFACGGFDPVPLPKFEPRRDDSLVAQDEILGKQPFTFSPSPVGTTRKS